MKKSIVKKSIAKVCEKIAPTWPLKNMVAVNPFLGLLEMPFEKASILLKNTSDIHLTMPLQFYLDKISTSEISFDDLKEALEKSGNSSVTVNAFLENSIQVAKNCGKETDNVVKTITDFVDEELSKNWNTAIIDHTSNWIASYVDEQQSLWNLTNSNDSLFTSWKTCMEVDKTPSLIGISSFKKSILTIPNSAQEAIQFCISELEISETVLEMYLFTILQKMLGWASYVAGIDWNNNLYAEKTSHLEEFLAILISWEYAVFQENKELISSNWDKNAFEEKNIYKKNAKETLCCSILQDAFDISNQRKLKVLFEKNRCTHESDETAKFQAVFCIDVRSETYRRHLENTSNTIETIGFAGFFGFPIKYYPLASTEANNQCPVLIPASYPIKESTAYPEKHSSIVASRKRKLQFGKIWRLFKTSPISSFSFVSPLGLSYFFKLLTDSFGLTRPIEHPENAGLDKTHSHYKRIDVSGIPLQEKITLAQNALTGMGIKNNFARLILIVGHGSTSTNNPHATGLDCGACGGHSGEINALTAQAILNDKSVRAGLQKNGIFIPASTHFVACLHDTTSDEIKISGFLDVPETHTSLVEEIREHFKNASEATRAERAAKMNVTSKNIKKSLVQRGIDWSQVRPEYGLVGCNTFVIAPRETSKTINLEGKSFLHSYDWKTDLDFSILESIMTAPMVVTSWINLQYYASTVDNKRLGSGNKTLHNITSGIGVMEGSGGDLRIGLPWQSVHDGSNLIHEPYRLQVIIKAPIHAINDILVKHPNLKALFDNNWIYLMHLNENNNIAEKYVGDFKWHTNFEYSKKKKLNETFVL